MAKFGQMFGRFLPTFGSIFMGFVFFGVLSVVDGEVVMDHNI